MKRKVTGAENKELVRQSEEVCEERLRADRQVRKEKKKRGEK